jgi:hypothetical protein
MEQRLIKITIPNVWVEIKEEEQKPPFLMIGKNGELIKGFYFDALDKIGIILNVTETEYSGLIPNSELIDNFYIEKMYHVYCESHTFYLIQDQFNFL